MNYIDVSEFKYAWIFRHQSLPLSTEVLDNIKIMSATRANSLWDTFVSKHADHPDFFKPLDWPKQKSTWCSSGQWQELWESDDPKVPQEITSFLAWDQNTVVYYCINRNQVIETTWANFQHCWKNLLFIDDGTLLIAKKRAQAVQFFSDGTFKIGKKTSE